MVPVADPLPPRLLAQVTWVTPTPSDAVPPMDRGVLVAVYVAPEIGEVMAIVGAVVSGGL
jgi:hypothetical protein